MITPQHRRARSLDKQYPRCLGKMVNLFDLTAGLTSNKLLTDRPHHPHGPTLSRSLSDMSMSPSSPSKNLVDGRRTVSHTRRSSSSQKSSGTPMKALIAAEMSKDVETKNIQSNVIAKLMGLDALPQKQQPHLSAKKRQSSAPEFWDKDCIFLDKEVQSELLKFHDYKGWTEFHEMLQQPNNPKTAREQPRQKGRQSRSKHEKEVDLVRQKFVDAKRLVTDEKLRHSREFHDALEVLSSNRELFLSFLQEPDSLFSGNLYKFQSLPRESKRITILRPSKLGDDDNLVLKQPPLVVEPDILSVGDPKLVYEHADDSCEDYPPKPTQIVVLKPNMGKNGEMKASSQPCFRDSNFDEKLISNKVAGDIPCPEQENLATVRRDETLLSSVFSNGYTGDGSSFYKSESEAVGNLSDSEITSTPRHSWDFVNKVGSPRSLSSFSRASYSPESSVCREAKKRLSERWALMSSHQKSQELRHGRTDSGTLGEMLSLMDTKKSVMPEGDSSKEQQSIGSTSWLVNDSNKEEEAPVELPKLLVRSKSVPVSSSFSNTLLVEETSAGTHKPDAPKEAAKKASVNSSFKGRVSSLFFFRSRKSSKEKSSKSLPKDNSQSTTVDTPGNSSDEQTKSPHNASEQVKDDSPGACSSPRCSQSHPEDADVQPYRSSVIHEGYTSDVQYVKSGMPDSKGNQDHPSPISVLDPSFEEDDNLTSESSGGQAPVLHRRFNLIDKSPPIGSIARTLSWDDSIDGASAPYLSKSSNVSPAMEEGLNWLVFVQTLMCEAGFDGQLSSHSFISRWYSPESPLDPSLREKYANATLPEGKCRQRRSERKLAFDCVNLALVKVTGCCGSSWSLINKPYAEFRNGSEPSTNSMIVDRVWAQMKEWFSHEVRCVHRDDGDRGSMVVEKVVRNEAVGKGWIENFGLEMDIVGRDIELKLLGELVDEAVKDLTGRL